MRCGKGRPLSHGKQWTCPDLVEWSLSHCRYLDDSAFLRFLFIVSTADPGPRSFEAHTTILRASIWSRLFGSSPSHRGRAEGVARRRRELSFRGSEASPCPGVPQSGEGSPESSLTRRSKDSTASGLIRAINRIKLRRLLASCGLLPNRWGAAA